MSSKVYTNEFKEAVVKYYETGHTTEETLKEFGVSESSLFAWRASFKNTHDLIIDGKTDFKNLLQKQAHFAKTEQLLEVIRLSNCPQDASNDEKYSVVRSLEGQYSVHVLCEALNLSRGTYYNRLRKENAKTQYEINDEIIKPLVMQIFEDSKHRFGRKPIWCKLKEMGYRVSENRVHRLMKEMNLEVERPIFKAEHIKSLPRVYFQDRLKQQFNQTEPNKVWVSDITYVKVGDQYYFVCVILDLFSRRVISYGVSDTIDTVLTLHTFDAAFETRKAPKGLMFHSDQGVQYTSHAFRKHLRELKVKQSFSTPASPHDNSVCESFFSTLKREAVYHHLYDTPEQLQEVLAEYIDFYNTKRPHRKLNMKTPAVFESELIVCI